MIKAREMPDFSKKPFQPIKDSGELTIPEGFDLASLKRHAKARDLLESKLAHLASEENNARYFRSKAMPDYEAQQICIMPSDKPSTVAIKPKFASDCLPKKAVKVASPKKTTSPKHFVF